MTDKNAVRIQTSFINGLERKVLVWLAKRQPQWMTSDCLTLIGTFGALVVATGFILTNLNINFLWLAILGLVINWYGDSLDGTLARVRNQQRPIYGYYLDHTVDTFNEIFMFVGAGLSSLMNLNIALMALIVYLLLTINVSVNAHLKGEFKLTYLKLGPTEFRIIMIITSLLFMYIRPLAEYSKEIVIFGNAITFGILDYVGIGIILLLLVIHIMTVINDAKGYAKTDPKIKKE